MHKDDPENAICEDCANHLGYFNEIGKWVPKGNGWVWKGKTLSSWIRTQQHPLAPYITITAVKDFISKLKEDFCTCIIDNINNKIGVLCKSCRKIDELAGPALIHSPHAQGDNPAPRSEDTPVRPCSRTGHGTSENQDFDKATMKEIVEKICDVEGTSDKGCANKKKYLLFCDNPACFASHIAKKHIKRSDKLKGDGK